MRLPAGLRRSLLSIVAALAAAATATVAVAVMPPAEAGPAPGLCRMSTYRGEVPDRFPVDACVDGSSIWLRNSLEVPVRFETGGDVDEPVTVQIDQTPAAVVTRRLEDRPGLLLPGDVMRIPLGEGEASATLADTDAGGAYVLATTLATFLPTGRVGAVINAITDLVGDLADAMADYGNCLHGKNWLQQLGCAAGLTRDVTVAIVSAGIEGLGRAAVSLIASTATYLRFLAAQPGAIRRILGGERTLTQRAGELTPPLDERALRNAPVPAMCDNPAGTMRDGLFAPDGGTGATGATGIVEAPRFESDGWGAVAVGDLDDDGRPEGALVLYCHWGGSGSDSLAVLYTDGPTIVGTAPVDGAAALKITDGSLDVVGLTNDGEDPNCCPSVIAGHRFDLEDGRVVEAERELLAPTAPVSEGTWGPLQLGSSYADAAMVLDGPLDVDDTISGWNVDFAPDDGLCFDATTVSGTPVSVIGSSHRTGVAYIHEPTVRTDTGVGVGSTAEDIRRAYGSRVHEEDNIYTDQPDLYVGGDPATDKSPGVRFILDDTGSAYLMMVGVQPYLGLAEGCA